MKDNKRIPITDDRTVFIKATPKDKIQAVNRFIQRKCDIVNTRQNRTPNKKYSTEVPARLPNGGAVLGKLTEEEKRALLTGDCRALRQCAIKRQREMEKKRRLR